MQSPIGKSSRSTPATYIGVFDAIRTLYAKQPGALEYGMSESYFSFNSKEGQCPVCVGQGRIKITFQYMADYYVTCTECKGSRYQEFVLEVLYNGKSIAEVLHMDISEAVSFFADVPDILPKLQLMEEVGLSYLKLGQSIATLSGGEAQRLKLAKELGGKQKKHMVYILDEPTTGLHFQDIEKLLLIFSKLADAGHTLYIIEHNTDVIRVSDWIVDIGPEGGTGGGKIVAAGTPEETKKNSASSIGWIFFFNDLRSFDTGIQLPASKSVMTQIVTDGQLMKANSIYTGIWSTIQLVSPGLGGLVMSFMSIEYIFLIDIGTAIIGVLLLATVTVPVREMRQGAGNTKERLLQGFHYIMDSKALRNSILLYTIFSFLVVPASQLTPLLVSQNIGDEVWMLSVIETAFFMGALAVSLFMGYKEIHTPHFKLIGLSAVIFGTTMILLLPAHGIVIFAVFMMIMG